MYEFIQNAHSGWAYLVIFFLLIAVINAFVGLSSKKEFTDKDKKLALFALIFTHVQLLFGLVLYFVSPMGKAVVGEMKDSALRLTWLEHPLLNIIAIILITIGWSKHKKLTTSHAKFKTFAVFYTIGLALILLRIPYKLWF
ncbi:hypothetical protein [Flavobacterium sp. SM2513]|uniref:hypothetical protein n=1 Tax=Flavobacterium sp. SM2513 TaxID=3424766 RepID=UPI003D7F262A